MMDIDDALGQQSLKTTLIADQGQDVILATANQMENQVALSTPGSEPFITAQARFVSIQSVALIRTIASYRGPRKLTEIGWTLSDLHAREANEIWPCIRSLTVTRKQSGAEALAGVENRRCVRPCR